jgi:hypothetical protein
MPRKFIAVFGVQHNPAKLATQCPWTPYESGMRIHWKAGVGSTRGVVGVIIGMPFSVEQPTLVPIPSAFAWYMWGVLRDRVPELRDMHPAMWIIPEPVAAAKNKHDPSLPRTMGVGGLRYEP